MAHEAVIKAEARTTTGTKEARRLRANGMVPGVVYGHGEAGVLLGMNEHDLLLSLHSGAHMFDLQVEGGKDEKVLVKEVQFDDMGDRVVHVDFIRVSLTEQVEVAVPIVTTGTSIGATKKGIVDQPLKELDITCLPTQIPDEIRVSITDLDIGMMKHVSDLVLPEGVVALNAADQVVVTVHPPTVEEEVEAAEGEEGGPAEPEVIGAKPDEDEDESEE